MLTYILWTGTFNMVCPLHVNMPTSYAYVCSRGDASREYDRLKDEGLLNRDLKPDGGTVWGTPLVMNADSFGYFPDKLGEPYPPEDVSWSLVFEDERTLGKSATGTMYYYFEECAMFCKGAGKVMQCNCRRAEV